MKRVLLPCVICLAIPLATLASQAGPRIGILSDAGSRQEADLLLLELQKAKCELVERDEVRRVLDEQTWQSVMSREGCRRIGRLLKADGLVLVSANRPGLMSFQSALIEGSTKLLTSITNQTLTVRLVAVEPGVLTYLDESPAEAPGWATNTAAALSEYFPKLSVKADAATPVSMLRVRPTNGYASSIQLANDLSPLLWQRLAKEPSLFVLDRENLPRVVEEAQWNGQQPGFWAGSVLVEGRASHDLANTKRALLTLTVQRPVAGTNTFTRVEWTESGELNNLPGLIERAAARLVSEIGSRVNNVPWDPQAEGRRLLSIVGHLVDPRQQKAAIGTAMSLGCRDIKTANEYRVALRSVAYRDAVRFSDVRLHLAPVGGLEDQARDFLELLRFHNDYRPPGGFDPNYQSAWHATQESEWLFSYFQPLNDIHTFLDGVKAAKRQGEISATIAEIQAALRETATRLLAIDPYYQKFQQGQIPLHGARYRYTTTSEILDTYRRFLFPPKTAGHYNGIGSTGGLWFLERSRAEPILTDHRTESAARRDELWREFQQQVLSSERPDIRINLALRELQQAKTPEEQRACRRRLQEVFASCSVAFAIASPAASHAGLYSEAYPTNTVVTPAQTYPRPAPAVIKPLSRDELRANARAAHQLFLAITPTNSLREADINCLIRPFLDVLTEDELRPVYQITRNYRYKSIYTNQEFPPRLDMFPIQQWIGERFPALLDDDYRAEQARRQATPPKEFLLVTNSIALSADLTRKPGRIASYHWQGDILRLLWDNDYLQVDSTRRTYESVALPAPPPDGSADILEARWLETSVELVRPGDWLTVDTTRRLCERVVFPSPPVKSAGKIHGIRWLNGSVRIVRGADLLIVDAAGRTCERVIFPPLPGGGPGSINGTRWLDDSLQLIRDGHFLVLDTRRRTAERVDPPSETDSPGQGRWTPALTSVDSMLIYLKSYNLEPNLDRPGTWMAWRPATGGDWRVARLPFGVGSVAWLNGKFYFTTGAPRIVVYQGSGVIEYDPATDKCVTLRTPGTPLERRTREDKNKPIRFENLEFGHGTKDGLLCGLMGQKLFGWDPVTQTVTDLNIPMPLSPRLPLAPQCQAFGFNTYRDFELRGWNNFPPLRVAGRTIIHRLPLADRGGTCAGSVPLCFPRLPEPVRPGTPPGDDQTDRPADAQDTGFAGPSFLLVPFESRRALHLIPYADIQQWIAANR